MVSSSNWVALPIGGGGYVDGVAGIATDMVCRTDTNGAFRRASAAWVQLFTATSLAACPDLVDPLTVIQEPAIEIQVARTAQATMYALYQGWLIKSTNAGATWSHCVGWTSAMVDSTSPNNGVQGEIFNFRGWAQRIAIDPVNADVVFVGTGSLGLFLTTDGGASFTAIPSVPSSIPISPSTKRAGITGIIFVPANSGQNSTGPSGVLQTGTVYVSSAGNGIYVTENAWDLVPTFTLSSPAGVLGAISSSTASVPWTTANNDTYFADQNGHLWHVTNPSGTITWTQNTAIIPYASVGGIAGIAVDPFNVLHLVGMCGGGRMCESINQGTSWLSYNQIFAAPTGEPGWLDRGGAANLDMVLGGMRFDPSTANELYCGGGHGFWQTTTPNCSLPNGHTLTWNSMTVGIENLVGLKIILPPGGRPVTASYDFGTHYSPSDTTYPPVNGPVNGLFCPASSLSYAAGTPSFVACSAYPWYGIGVESSSYSNDGGAHWTKFSTLGAIPSNVHLSGAGTIVVSTPMNMIWAPGGGSNPGCGQPSYTTDGGATWNLITITGVSGWENMTNATYCGEAITADPNTPLTFYFNANKNMTGAGLYKTVDGGMNWTSVCGPISGGTKLNSGNSSIRVVPGHPTDLFYHDDGSAHSIDASLRLWKSTDSGLTWTQVPNVVCPTHIGFGKALAGGSGYPALYMVGFMVGTPPVYGIWECDNADSATPTYGSVGTYPTGNMTQIVSITGSMDTYGRVVCATGGAGYFLKYP